MQIVKYENEAEAIQIIQEKESQGLILVEVLNITDGSFLGFSENPIIPKTPLEQQIEEVKQQNLVLMDAMATLYETVAALGGGV